MVAVMVVSLWFFFTILILYIPRSGSGKTQGGTGQRCLRWELYMPAILTEVQSEEKFRKSACLSEHRDPNYQIKHQV